MGRQANFGDATLNSKQKGLGQIMGKGLRVGGLPSLTLRNIPLKRFTGSFYRSCAASGLFLAGITALMASFVPAGAVTL
jgi:hypothetical protein